MIPETQTVSPPRFFQLIPPGTNIDFISKFKLFTFLSGLLCAAVVALMFTKGFNFGIDFTGGTVLQLKLKTPRTATQVRDLLAELGEKEATAVAFGADNLEYLITTRTESLQGTVPLITRLKEKLGREEVIPLKEDQVGPKVGAELKLASLRALFYSIIFITIYIWFRFDIRFAPGATVAMIHDLIMACGFYILTGREFTITAIAALLTIAGYSVNDTIVIYDRVRELLKIGGTAVPLPGNINRAVNLTLSRTLLTSGITLISIIPLVIFCTGEIQSFAIAMVWGIFVGSYSTIYIASPLTIYVERLQRWWKNRKSLATAST